MPWRSVTALACVLTIAQATPAQYHALGTTAAAGTSASASAGSAAVAATVGDVAIPEAAVERSLKRFPADKMQDARVEVLNFLIENALVDQYLAQKSVTAEPAEIEAKLKQATDEIKKNGSSMEKVLQELSLTEAELRGQISAQLRWDKFATSQATDDNLKRFFETHQDMFDGSLVHARHILLTPPVNDGKAAAEARVHLDTIRKSLEAGALNSPKGKDAAETEKLRVKTIEDAFAVIASKESVCPSKQQGGDLGWFPRGGNMVEPFAKAAFALSPGQMSDVVPTQFGLHLILVTERKPGHPTKFEDVKDLVREIYAEQLREQICAELRQTTRIVINSSPKK
jgi:peptidyl-prolyl cis-trans isomerase C